MFFKLNKLIYYAVTLTVISSILINASNPYAGQQAQVRASSALCDQEQSFCAARLLNVKQSLEQALGTQLTDNQVPQIALCASGGGFRAMVATLGWLEGSVANVPSKRVPFASSLMQHIYQWFGWSDTSTPSAPVQLAPNGEIRNLCTYFATLSGSTWALAGLDYSQMSASQYLVNIEQKINTSFYTNFNMEDLVIELKKKEQYNQPISFIDIYGIVLAQKLLANLGTNTPSAIDIASYANDANTTAQPLAIQTSIIGNDGDDYQWIEYTPYEVGSAYLNAFIPTWAFGRKFNNGSSVDFAPPQSLGFCMGTWGSAMSLDAQDFFRLVIDPDLGTISAANLEAKFGSIVASGASILSDIEQKFKQASAVHKDDPIADARISPSQVFNWTLGMANAPMGTDQTLTLVDGGIDCNLPVFPLLRRGVDIIIILDASAGTFGAELHNAQQHAQKWGYPFPAIDYTTINQPCSVHWDKSNVNAPIVIYMPLIKSANYNNGWDPWAADFTSTYNFTYTPAQTQLLSGLTSYNMAQSMPKILSTIQQWVATRN